MIFNQKAFLASNLNWDILLHGELIFNVQRLYWYPNYDTFVFNEKDLVVYSGIQRFLETTELTSVSQGNLRPMFEFESWF